MSHRVTRKDIIEAVNQADREVHFAELDTLDHEQVVDALVAIRDALLLIAKWDGQ